MLAALLALPCLAASPFDDWRSDAPGVERRYDPAQIPPPKGGTDIEAPDLSNHPRIVHAVRTPKAPPGFSVSLFASGLSQPRTLRTAPGGDVFLAESGAGRILVFSAADGRAGEARPHVFSQGLSRPYGLAFWPPGPDPRWLYVGEPTRIVRFAYRSGALAAAGAPQVIVAGLPGNHHWTRDLLAAPNGKALLYAIGSGSNEAGDMARAPPSGWIAGHPLGEAWGPEAGRAQVRVFDPAGKVVETVAAGLRNCTGMALQPGSGDLWCVVNERDGLGDNTPPDYATTVRKGAFYGWPWYYIGDHADPRLGGRADLEGKVTVPDVLLQAHTAPLSIAFYDGGQFPAAYRGDAFVAMHGSWDRTRRVGYKVVRLRFAAGKPTGIVQDFLTGFVIDDASVSGRPVGVAVAADGALLVSDDGSGSIWRVAWKGS
jgi:glucose/arabinose dehydrogenase